MNYKLATKQEMWDFLRTTIKSEEKTFEDKSEAVEVGYMWVKMIARRIARKNGTSPRIPSRDDYMHLLKTVILKG
ncbi:MAG: hypothetical protein HXO49_02280 [Prevotella sp.]|jgi:hypothetical protein|nr:hypothetical protein [Prevotella sp.]